MLKNLKTFNVEALDDLIQLETSGDHGLLQELFETYKIERRSSVDQLVESAAKNDFVSIEDIAHTLKSGSSLLGLDRVAFIASEIEEAARNKKIDLTRFAVLRRQFEIAVNELDKFTLSRQSRSKQSG